MTRVELSSRVRVAGPPAEVWAYLSDWARQGEWIPLTSVEPLDGDGRRAGARIRARTGVGRLSFLDPMTVTGWQPPHRIEVRHDGRLVCGEARVSVETSGNATEVTWTEVLLVPGGRAGLAAWRLGRPVFQRLLSWSLHRLRDRLQDGRSARR
jgi:carbon monoxide dehydrogenase subunit G